MNSTNLTLTEEQKETVKRVNRSLSVEVLENGGGNGRNTQYVASLNDEEVVCLRDAVKAFEIFKRETTQTSEQYGDTTDGKVSHRSYPVRDVRENYHSFSWSSATSTVDSSHTRSSFVNPGRFIVRFSQETAKTLKQIYEEITFIRREPILVHKQDASRLGAEGSSCSNGKIPEDSLKTEDITVHTVHHNGDLTVRVTVKKPKSDLTVPVKATCEERELPNDAINQEGFPPGSSKRKNDLTPKERFRKAGLAVIQYLRSRPRQMDKDLSKLWLKRGQASWLSIMLTVVAMGAFFADIGTDLKVSADHFGAGNNWWGGLTLCLVFIPCFIVNVVSFLWYNEDEEKACRKPESGWRIVMVTHFFQLGLLERYWRILRRSFCIKKKKYTKVVDHKILIAMNLDMSMLQMILAFTEDAPQLVLQLYVFVRRHYFENLEGTSLQDLWTVASICFSFISYSRGVVNYISCLRDSKRHKGQLRWYGYLSMWLWRASMFISRVLVLVSFATEFKMYFFLVLVTHIFVTLVFLSRQEVYFFIGHRWTQHFFRAIIAYIHVFCLFSLEGIRTIRWAIIYYSLTFVENVIFSLLWFTNDTRLLPLGVEISVLVVSYVLFVFALCMMIVYYKVLHPKFKRPRLKWKEDSESELNERESDNSESRDPRPKFELWI